MRYLTAFICVVFSITAVTAVAQEVITEELIFMDPQRSQQLPLAPHWAQESTFERNLFTPEMIMRNRAKLELNESQKNEIIELVQEFQSGIVAVEWNLEEAKASLDDALGAQPIQVKNVEQALDSVLQHEARVKKMHLLMLVKIKDALQPAQIDTLRQIKRRSWTGHLKNMAIRVQDALPHRYSKPTGPTMTIPEYDVEIVH